MQLIEKLLGVIKIFISFIVLGGCLMAFIDPKKYESTIGTVAVIIVGLIVVTYLYYLVKSALWNLNSKLYRINLFILLGLLIQFGIVYLFFYLTFFYAKQITLPILPILIVVLAINVYDTFKIYRAFKCKISKRQNF